MNIAPNTNICMFGSLYTFRRLRGQAPSEEVSIPIKGCTGLDLAKELDLPLEKIEGIFINNFARSHEELIHPGDKVAFISAGVPGPHRYSLSTHSVFKCSVE